MKEEQPVYDKQKKMINNNFMYHSPSKIQGERYYNIRETAKILALLIGDLCPLSREKSLAMTKLEECVMWANASIARNNETGGTTEGQPKTNEGNRN